VTGALVVVGTPIGNLGDLAPRAIDALRSVDVLACEDTRRTGRLLAHAAVDVPKLVVVNDHTEGAMVDRLVARIERGERVGLVSDAGMPAISDPGERLIAAVVAADLPVEVVPGPSAALTALVASGYSTGRFVFEGFLPRKGAARRQRLAVLATEPRTIVLYEAPHRMATLVDELCEHFGPDRPIALARELTKLHEEVWRGSALAAVERIGREGARGEFVVVVAGAPSAPPPTGDEVVAALRLALAAGSSKRDAIAEVARSLGVPKREVYTIAVDL